MNAHAPEGSERPLALGLAAGLDRALEPDATPQALRAAREAAGILTLDSLEQLLIQLQRHAGSPWPSELDAVRDRLRRTCARAREAGSLEPFRAAAGDWAALARELAAMEWTLIPALGRGVATVAASQVFDDLPIAALEPAVERSRLTAPVAAALRAALDWLAGEAGFRRPLRARADESLLEITGDGLDPHGLEPAHRVIAAVDGSLGPNPRPGESGWSLRVPAVAARDHFLTLEQGSLRLALPWHSVLRLQSVPERELEARAAALGIPLLKPLAPLATAPPERPVVTIAHGLRRGWVIADRLIWRLPADPCEPDAGASAAGLTRAVRTDEGEVYAVANAGDLLGSTPDVPALAALTAAARMAASAAPAAALAETATNVAPDDALAETATSAAPAAALAGEPRPAGDAPAAEADSHATLAAESVEPLPLTLELADVIPLPVPMESAASEPAEAPAAPELPATAALAPELDSADLPVLTALVVEDAIAAQAFLARVLEDRGFEVTVASRAQELDRLIESRTWTLVLLDVDLPDASGTAFLRAASDRVRAQRVPPPVVALVRDRQDEAVASLAGVDEILTKPVAEAVLVRLIERLAAAHRLSA